MKHKTHTKISIYSLLSFLFAGFIYQNKDLSAAVVKASDEADGKFYPAMFSACNPKLISTVCLKAVKKREHFANLNALIVQNSKNLKICALFSSSIPMRRLKKDEIGAFDILCGPNSESLRSLLYSGYIHPLEESILPEFSRNLD
jgi:hypothetical protein